MDESFSLLFMKNVPFLFRNNKKNTWNLRNLSCYCDGASVIYHFLSYYFGNGGKYIFCNVIYIEWKFCVILWKWFWCNFQWLNEFYMPQVFLWAGKKHTQICRLFIGIVSSIFLGNCKWKSFWGLMIFQINFYNRFLEHKYID